MKSNRILVLMFACAVLLATLANAEQPESKTPSASSQRAAHKDGGHPRNHTHASASGRTKAQANKQTIANARPNATREGQPHSSAGINSPHPAGRVSNEREPVSRGNSADLSQASRRHDDFPAKGATVTGNTANNALPGRPPSVALHATPMSVSTRHRGPNPAVVGGAANAKAANAGAISGNTVHRKP